MTSTLWAFAASVMGGIIGASVKFTFDDIVRPRLGWRRDMRRIVSRFTTPLIRSSDSLERRINNFVRNIEDQWFETDEYYRLSTLYVFGEHLGWIRIIERRFGFVPIEAVPNGKRFSTRLNGIFRALTSHGYFRTGDTAGVTASALPRLMLTAIGEAMTATDRESVLEFTDFARRYVTDEQFARWFADLDSFLRRAHPTEAYTWERLIIAGAELRALVEYLDPKGRMVPPRPFANLDQLTTPGMRDRIERDLAATRLAAQGAKHSMGSAPCRSVTATEAGPSSAEGRADPGNARTNHSEPPSRS